MKNSKINIDIDDKIINYMIENNINNINNINSENIDLIKKIVYLLLEDQKLDKAVNEICVSIQSVTEDEIKNINREYRNIDKSTDVLSFPIFEKEELDEIINQDIESKKIQELELGDIIICLDVVKRQSIEYDTGLKREMLYMITHGMCHLLGFDHIEEEEKIEMRNLEEKILNKLGVVK